MFQTLHVLFMDHYTEQWNALDLIAERIRSLGLPAPGTYKEFSRLASIKEVEGTPSANEMIRILVSGQEAVARTARSAFAAAEAANDQPTCDLLTQRMQVHEKNAWMLRSLLEDGGRHLSRAFLKTLTGCSVESLAALSLSSALPHVSTDGKD